MVQARGGGAPMTLWSDSWIRRADSRLGSKRELERSSALQLKDCHAHASARLRCHAEPQMPVEAGFALFVISGINWRYVRHPKGGLAWMAKMCFLIAQKHTDRVSIL